jgi:EAL domain-containing protein (putative c-di-GMP-specific phosphodiesterase class I)
VTAPRLLSNAHAIEIATPSTWPQYSYSFQPIIDANAGRVIAYEALVRGPHGEPAPTVLRAVPPSDIYRFDEISRITAIEIAARLNLDVQLNLNFLPLGLRESETAISSVLEAASRCGIAAERIVMEVTEGEAIDDIVNFDKAIEAYRVRGLGVAIDDFGAGYSGLNLLANFQPDSVKLDMLLVRGIDCHGPRQAIVRAIIQVCTDLGIDLIAEGVETRNEYRWLRDQGVSLFQGYLFAKPQFETLPGAYFPDAPV